MTGEIIKYLQIAFVLSPFFLTVILVGVTLTKLSKKMSKNSIFWLTGFIMIAFALTYGLLSGNISTYSIFIALPGLYLYWDKFLKLKKKGK